MSSTRCDDAVNDRVIVLGAGPAGCAAALRARQAGLNVVMFDVNASPKAAPGETLHPGVEPLLRQLGVLDAVLQEGFRRHRGVWHVRGNARRFLPYGQDADGEWQGFQVDRRIFHRILQQAAVDAGATLIRNARAEAVRVEDGRVTGVVVNGTHHCAAWIIDATGRHAWLARQLALDAHKCSPPLAARFGWRTDESAAQDGEPVFTFRDNGWSWQAPLGDDRTAWVELRVGDPDGSAPAGVDLTWTLRPRCAGPGYFLAGDAAALFDPSSSHGILRALMSGILCGHLMEGCQRADITAEQAADTYREWVCAQFAHDEQRLRPLYSEAATTRRRRSMGRVD